MEQSQREDRDQQQNQQADHDVATMSDAQFRDSLDALLGEHTFAGSALSKDAAAQIVGEVDATLLGGFPLAAVEESGGATAATPSELLASSPHTASLQAPVAGVPTNAQGSFLPSFGEEGAQMRSMIASGNSASLSGYPLQRQPQLGGFAGSTQKSTGRCSTTPTTATASSCSSSVASSTTARKRTFPQHKQEKRSKTNNNNAATAAAPAISEDEVDARKRRNDRNAREQARSQRITDQIAELHELLEQSDVQHKPDKFHTLLQTAQYIRELQHRAGDLQKQHEQLLQTLQQTTEQVNMPYSGGAAAESVASMVTSGSVVSFSGSDRSAATVELAPCASPASEQPNAESSFTEGGFINYKWIFDCCPFASAVASIDGRFLECNPQFEAMSGYTRDELLVVPPHKTRNLSLFNILRRPHIERVFAPLSEMLQYNEDTRRLKTRKDHLAEVVQLGRPPHSKLQLGVTLIRSPAGLPRFFNCVLTPASVDDDTGKNENDEDGAARTVYA